MLQDILIERKVYASEEHKMMKGMIQEFISNEIMDHIDEWEKNGMVSREIWKRAGELGLLCIDMPEIYGGGGLDFTFALLIEEFAKGISGPGFSLHSDIVAPYLLKYGTEDQKQKYLQMAKGK
jgi:acyl-CoA dehydrogenase